MTETNPLETVVNAMKMRAALAKDIAAVRKQFKGDDLIRFDADCKSAVGSDKEAQKQAKLQAKIEAAAAKLEALKKQAA